MTEITIFQDDEGSVMTVTEGQTEKKFWLTDPAAALELCELTMKRELYVSDPSTNSKVWVYSTIEEV